MRALFFTIICLILVFFGTSNPAFSQDKELKSLGKLMVGSWDTFAQVEEDEANDTKYKHIRALMHVVPVEIPQLKMGLAYYVENQDSANRPRPYRQRVYFLTRIDGKITLQIYKISQPEDLVNAHKNSSLLKKLTFDRLSKEEGCDLVYERKENIFKGKIIDAKSCKSTLRGAAYTYSESEISKDKWINLDQGFDEAGNHKWGPPPGTFGHIFRRRNK